ncbi:hypothetical protein AGMMS49975_10000 [Clostridia bacterium]|nr:hypothetical protein AGMMS49975_10000 [Clostridia bacterium]
MEIEKFGDLVGNVSPLSLIRKGLRVGTLPQFVMLAGMYGVGKSSVAELTAMALTCEQRAGGEACGKCETCRRNRLAFGKSGGGVSPCIEKVNMAKVAKEKSMLEQLRSTFEVIRSDGVYVKIFEEFHALSESDQRLMLEETARVPNNVYVILTTTKKNWILKEIVSRCLVFYFGRLNTGEARILVDRVNVNLKLKLEDYKQIYRKTNGVPRDIVVLIEFLSKTRPTAEELSALFGMVDKSVFVELFAEVGDFRTYMESAGALQEKWDTETVKNQLKDFLAQVVFAMEGQIYDVVKKRDLMRLPWRSSEEVMSAVRVVESVGEGENSLDLMFMKLRRQVAAPMSVAEQKNVAEVSSAIKVQPTEKQVELKRFRSDVYASTNG